AVGCVGGHNWSPALDAIAAEGVMFRRAVTSAPDCIPARFALATGLYPHQTGIWSNGQVALAPAAWNWIKALRESGYQTSLFGKTHFHETAQASGDLRDGLALMREYGFDEVDEIAGPRGSMHTLSNMTEGWRDAGLWDPYRRDFEERFATKPYLVRPSPLGQNYYYDTYVGQRATEYLSSCPEREPWFCWVSFGGPHEPWDAPPPYDRMYEPRDMPKPLERTRDYDKAEGLLGRLFKSAVQAPPLTPGEVAEMRANYAGNVRLIDDQIRIIIDTVKARGFYENTLVIFASDHGEMNGDHGLIYKRNFLASAVEIPLIVRPPGPSSRIASHTASEALVELIDIGPTVLDYAGLPSPPWSGARSLRPLMEGRTPAHRSFVVSEFAGYLMIANQRGKAEFTPDRHPTLLFDRDADPSEQSNLIEEWKSSPLAAELEIHLQEHLAQNSEIFATGQRRLD
ncbi:MAG: sulfatase-like hydrolase/transferase, partial [Bryobacteraceae bacterium]